MQRNETDEYERYRYRYQKRGCGMHTIDIIILTVVAALLLLALRSTLRHYGGKGGGCCGCSGCSGGSSSCSAGGSVEPFMAAGKPAGTDTLSKTLQIEGMHCGACKQSVESALAGINGVVFADVNLEKGTAKVVMRENVEDALFREAVEDNGFELKGILKAGTQTQH